MGKIPSVCARGGLKAADFQSQSAALHPRNGSQGSSRDAEHCRLSGALPKGETGTLGGQEIQREVPDGFHCIPGFQLFIGEGRERCRADPTMLKKEIIEASGIHLGLELTKSIIANQFFDDLCPLLFGLGMAHGGTGIFTNSHAKTSALSAGFVSRNETLKSSLSNPNKTFQAPFLHRGAFPGSLTKA